MKVKLLKPYNHVNSDVAQIGDVIEVEDAIGQMLIDQDTAVEADAELPVITNPDGGTLKGLETGENKPTGTETADKKAK